MKARLRRYCSCSPSISSIDRIDEVVQGSFFSDGFTADRFVEAASEGSYRETFVSTRRLPIFITYEHGISSGAPKNSLFMTALYPRGDRLRPTLNDYGCLSPSVTMMSTEPWVTAEQVSLHLGVAKDTVYRWREHKALPAHRIGRLWKFQLSEIDEWVRAGGADEHQNSGNG